MESGTVLCFKVHLIGNRKSNFPGKPEEFMRQNTVKVHCLGEEKHLIKTSEVFSIKCSWGFIITHHVSLIPSDGSPLQRKPKSISEDSMCSSPLSDNKFQLIFINVLRLVLWKRS